MKERCCSIVALVARPRHSANFALTFRSMALRSTFEKSVASAAATGGG